MQRLLRCSNEDCESHKDNQHTFSNTVSFEDDGTLAENPKHIEGSSFTCNFCESKANWREVTTHNNKETIGRILKQFKTGLEIALTSTILITVKVNPKGHSGMNRLQYINKLKEKFPNSKSIWSPTRKRFIVTGTRDEIKEDQLKIDCDLYMSSFMESYETGKASVSYVTGNQMRIEDAINNSDCTC